MLANVEEPKCRQTAEEPTLMAFTGKVRNVTCLAHEAQLGVPIQKAASNLFNVFSFASVGR